MVLVRVQYDAYNRQFRLLDQGFAHILKDGENYLLMADLSVEDLKLTEGVDAEPIDPILAATVHVDI